MSAIWHRNTAVNLRPGMTVQEQLQAAGLDWEVHTSGFNYGPKFQFAEEARQAAYRSDTGLLLDVYGPRRLPFQNGDILGTFNRFCEGTNLSLDYLGSLKEGRTVYAAARLPHEYNVDVRKKGDITEAYLLLTEHHTNGKGLSVCLYLNRLVCTNGMTRMVKDGNRIIHHVGKFNSSTVERYLELAMRSLQKYQATVDKLAEVSMTREEATLHLIKCFGQAGEPVQEQPRLVQTCLRLFDGEAKGAEQITAYNTAYGLMEAVSEYFNWKAPAKGTAETRFNSLLTGARGAQIRKFEKQLVGVYIN
jgi:phage/plasmid-like protein (TIGR03299 family)